MSSTVNSTGAADTAVTSTVPDTSTTSTSDTDTSTSTPDTTSSTDTPTTTTPTSTSTPTTSPTTPSTTSTSEPTTSETTTPTPTTTPTTLSTTTSESSSSSTTEEPSTSAFTTTKATTLSNGSTQFVTVTSVVSNTASSTSDAASATSSGAGLISSGGSSSAGLSQGGKIAIAVICPIIGVALLVVAGIFFWKKRKQRRDAEEERRKEVEDYSYNPNNDPTLPDVSSIGGAGAYEMREDGSSGYRGWGSTTLGGSTGRKASTTMSGGAAGAAHSGANSPTRGNMSDTRSGEPLMSEHAPEGEILGAMGPNTAENRGANVHRGTSNASSSYSAAGRSDGSADNVGVAYGGGPGYYDPYGANNPYSDNTNGQQRPGELGGQPVIRDNPARRNTRIENPSHYPQQSAGISQNF